MRIPIFMICDNNYSPYMAVLIASICKNTNKQLDFYVLGKGITDENKILIEDMKKSFSNFDINYKTIDITKDFNISYLVSPRMTSSTYIRMLLPELYPEIDKMLIMDVDIISLKDISLLWEQDIDGYTFAATLDEPLDAYYIFKKNMDVNIDCKYANCGVMLIDCKKWRKDKITNKCLEIEKIYRDKLNCSDQDVINKIFAGNFKQLDSKFNSLLGNEKEIVNRHFCYLRKPWLSKYNIEGDLIKNFDDWWEYAKMTPFYSYLLKQYNEFTNNSENASFKDTYNSYTKMEMMARIRNELKIKKLNKKKD